MLIPQKLMGLIVLSVALLLLSNLPSAAYTRTIYDYAINNDGLVAYLEKHLVEYQNAKIAAIEINFCDPNA